MLMVFLRGLHVQNHIRQTTSLYPGGTTISDVSDKRWPNNPGMKQKGWGRIINISSISAGTGGGPGGGHYASAKAGLSAFTKGLAKELGLSGITVNAVAPGVILTEIHEKFSTKETLEFIKKQIPLGRLGQPEDITGAVLFLASDSASYITGETIAVNGGLRMD